MNQVNFANNMLVEDVFNVLMDKSVEQKRALCPPLSKLKNDSIGGMEYNTVYFPGIFDMTNGSTGKSITKSYLQEGNKYFPISEQERIKLNIDKKKDFITYTINMQSGQMGEEDFKLYCYLEQYIYGLLNGDTKYYSNDAQFVDGNGYVEIYIDTVRQFSLKALGYSNTKSCNAVNSFFERLTGLSITFSGNATNAGYSVKSNPDKPAVYCKLTYKPFDRLTMKGSDNKRKIHLGIHRDYVKNMINGGCKLYYSEYMNKIQKGTAKALFRLLLLRDDFKKTKVSYDEIVTYLGIKKYDNLSRIRTQIADIARSINVDDNERILMYTSLEKNAHFSKNYPFATWGEVGSLVFVFKLNSELKPKDKYLHDPNDTYLDDFIKEHNLSKDLVLALRADASTLGIDIDTYIKKGFPTILLSKAAHLADMREVSIEQNKKRKKKTEMAQIIAIGSELKNIAGGINAAKGELAALLERKKIEAFEEYGIDMEQ